MPSNALTNVKLGIGITGSFCTFKKIFEELEKLSDKGYDLTTVFSYNSYTQSTRFGSASHFITEAERITGKDIICTITQAEKVGPAKLFDVFLIAPCTGNTLAKLANAITDTPVLMAAKSHLRNNRPVVIFLSSNDALAANLSNIGTLLNRKNIYFVPFSQDNPIEKPNSMISDFSLIEDSITAALDKRQLTPVISNIQKD